VARRLTRAKGKLREVRAEFEVPAGPELQARLPDVLEVVYLIFNEGYAASSGERWVRTELCEEALRLGRILAALAPREPEAHGLIALLEIQASRLAARLGPDGEPVLLLDQDRSRWDPLLIVRGLAALRRAEELPAPLGPYGLQAAIAACHARARAAAETDWVRIAALYEALAALSPSPIVELNRAVAVGMAFGPETGLALLESVAEDPALREYHLLPSVRGDLLSKLGREEEAVVEFRRAASLTDNASERRLLLARAESTGGR
jgi:predicted RNA polymerase sigma factor